MPYTGAPIRDRGRRPSVPRAHRRKTLQANGVNKENMRTKANDLYSGFNNEITQLALSTGFSRSSVARHAFKTGKGGITPRKATSRNGWTSIRMKEVNASEFILIL